MDYLHGFSNIEQALHHWNKLHLFVVYTLKIYILLEKKLEVVQEFIPNNIIPVYWILGIQWKKWHVCEWAAASYLYTCIYIPTIYLYTGNLLVFTDNFPYLCYYYFFTHSDPELLFKL